MQVKTYWWNSRVNLGDQLTPIILKSLYSVEAQYSSPAEATLISTGSILNQAFGERVRSRVKPIHVVGSGFISHDQTAPQHSAIRIHSVRGHLTASRLNATGRFPLAEVGDPGLLAAQVVGMHNSSTLRKKYDFGVVLHYVLAGDASVKAELGKLGKVKFLNIETDDLTTFSKEMLECEVVLSHSLHGLIIADSLGLPSVWLNLGGLVG